METWREEPNRAPKLSSLTTKFFRRSYHNWNTNVETTHFHKKYFFRGNRVKIPIMRKIDKRDYGTELFSLDLYEDIPNEKMTK